jgi:micrococcal nuclease
MKRIELFMVMSKSANYFYQAKVVSVYDGDTCRADIKLGFGVTLENKTIRLSGIDTAEIRGGDNKEDAFKARDRLRELILNKEVVLQTMKDRTGKYGRIIGTIFVDGQNVNELLVEEGLAQKTVTKNQKFKRNHHPKPPPKKSQSRKSQSRKSQSRKSQSRKSQSRTYP